MSYRREFIHYLFPKKSVRSWQLLFRMRMMSFIIRRICIGLYAIRTRQQLYAESNVVNGCRQRQRPFMAHKRSLLLKTGAHEQFLTMPCTHPSAAVL